MKAPNNTTNTTTTDMKKVCQNNPMFKQANVLYGQLKLPVKTK